MNHSLTIKKHSIR